MRAVVVHAPHDLRIDAATVADPGPGEVRVRLAVGGICGSDLHYYLHGGFGTIRIREPLTLGHEVAGTVASVGAGVTRVKAGDRIAISPSRPCGRCRYCAAGARQHCLDMRFFGSAMRFPHVQGAFRDEIVIDESQAFPVGDTPFEEAVFAEPFAVALSAVKQAGSLLGKRVLVTGSGPIGCLAILGARAAGASEIVATDAAAAVLATARKVGADCVFDVGSDPQALSPYAADKGHFDVAFECSGNARALTGALDVVRPGGTVVMLGMGGEAPLPMTQIVAKELVLRGSFRFDAEFGWAVDLIRRRAVDVRPLRTGSFPVDRAVEAFDLAADRSKAMKVQIDF